MARRKRNAIVAAVLMVALGGGGVLAWALWPAKKPKPPDPLMAAPADVAKFMASPDFAKLSIDARQKYANEARQAQTQPGRMFRAEGLSDQERQTLRQNMAPVMEQAENQRMAAYFKMPDDQKLAYLDKSIDDMQTRQQDRANRPQPAPTPTDAQGQPTSRPGGGQSRVERMRTRIETADPLAAAQRAEFRKQLRARMAQRGIALPSR